MDTPCRQAHLVQDDGRFRFSAELFIVFPSAWERIHWIGTRNANSSGTCAMPLDRSCSDPHTWRVFERPFRFDHRQKRAHSRVFIVIFAWGLLWRSGCCSAIVPADAAASTNQGSIRIQATSPT